MSNTIIRENILNEYAKYFGSCEFIDLVNEESDVIGYVTNVSEFKINDILKTGVFIER